MEQIPRTIPLDKTRQETSLTKEQNDLLKKVYYTDSVFVGRDHLYKYICANYPESGISRRMVMSFLKLQKPYQLTVRPPKRIHSSLMDIRKVGYMSCDLKGPLARDKGYEYIFGLCDVASRKTFCLPIRSASAQDSVDALKIIATNDLKVTLLRSDNGTSFKGIFTDNLKNKGIVQLFSAPHSPWMNRIERQWGTFASMLKKYQIANNTTAWVDILDTLVQNMNATVVSSIKITPNEAFDGELPIEVNEQRSKDYGNMKRFQSTKSALKIGDFVRLRIRNAGKFAKTKQTYSSDVYMISKVINDTKTSLVTYKVTLDGTVNRKESWNITDLLLVNDSEDLPEFAEIVDEPERTITDQREVDSHLQNTNNVQVIRETRNPKADSKGEYEVEKILSKRKFGKTVKYLVKYAGYPVSDATWEQAKNINAPELMREFRERERQKKKK